MIRLHALKMLKRGKLPLNVEVSVRWGKKEYQLCRMVKTVSDPDFNHDYIVDRIQIYEGAITRKPILFKGDTWLDNLI